MASESEQDKQLESIFHPYASFALPLYSNSHWRCYTGTCSILSYSPVAYLRKPQVKEEFQKVLKNIYDNQEFLKSVGRQNMVNRVYNMLIAGVTCLKHDGFKEEREWRLIYAPNRWSSQLSN